VDHCGDEGSCEGQLFERRDPSGDPSQAFPTARRSSRRTYARSKHFLKEAVPYVLLGVFMKELGLRNTAKSALIMVFSATIVGTLLHALLTV